MLLHAEPGIAHQLDRAFVLGGYGVLAAIFIALVIRKFVRASVRMRRILAPLLLAAVVAGLRALTETALTFTSLPQFFASRLYWWQVAGQILLPIAMLVGLLRARLARSHVGELVLELDHTPPEGSATLLPVTSATRASSSSSGSRAGRLRRRDRRGGRASEPASTRSVTAISHGGERIAVIVHDRSLDDEPQLLQAAATAARLTLENARLHAEVRAQLVQVEESRRRIVAAGDEQRRRIERDIHDGAQQRLVALALELRATQRRLGGRVDPDVERVLTGAVAELQVAVSELRELARGVHPAILTEEGLPGALESLASRTPLDVRVEGGFDERLPPEIEAAGYFLACEALANAVKHADATHVRISAVREDGKLVLEVVDDGCGGADPTAGSGLRGLADRLEAHGGRLVVADAAGGGTRVLGEIPCAS